jgi:hypothetical protein
MDSNYPFVMFKLLFIIFLPKYLTFFKLVFFQDLISKWEKYAQDHQSYENRLAEFDDWIKQAETKLEVCQQSAADQETMEERRTMIQVIILFVKEIKKTFGRKY